MSPKMLGCRRLAALVAVLVTVAATQSILAPVAGGAAGFVPISGSGSTWSSNALDQWRKNVAGLYGITVNFAPNGSTSGRNDFRAGQVDFAVSEIPFGLSDGGVLDPAPARGYGYMPIVAGGTSFMYNLHVGTKRVTNLRLSGDTIAKIFTQQVKKWDDPAIKADNPQVALPARQIVPVVYSNGSGTTAQFTTWMADQYPSIWDSYCRSLSLKTPCGFTSFYPLGPGMEAKAQSQGVSGFVAQDSSEGAITFVEYSYARNSGFPVAKVLNKANYYVEPQAGSVAVALLDAKIHPDLTQDLTGVYVNPDPRTYPLSSYSYMIIPKDTTQNFNLDKGKTLSEFAAYFLCEGQQQADTLGYSPLPINLVQAGVDQISQIPGSTKKLDRNNLAHCNNPTVSPEGGNLVAKNAPQPSPCDLKGAPQQCASGTGGAQQSTPTSGGGTPSAGGGESGSGGGGGTGNGGSGGGGDTGSGGSRGTDGTGATASGDAGTLAIGGSPGGGAAAGIDPDTGQAVGGMTPAGSSGSTGASAVPVSVDVTDTRRQVVLAMLAAVLLLGLIVGPPLVARSMRSRDGPEDGQP